MADIPLPWRIVTPRNMCAETCRRLACLGSIMDKRTALGGRSTARGHDLHHAWLLSLMSTIRMPSVASERPGSSQI